MAKSQKAKKARKAALAKAKMKVGKKLQKPQNETRTEFRSRKILIREQLAQKEDEQLLTKRHHNLKELLSRLKHHSVTVRREGISGIQELARSHEPDHFTPHMNTIMAAVIPVILDTDSTNREAAVTCIEAIIVKMGFRIEPYFGVMATYLSCAMAQLNMGVQADSLKLINVLVLHTPALIAQHATSLLKNFIDLISRKASTSAKGSGTKKEGQGVARVLTVNPNSTLSQHKFHLELLTHLGGFLEALVKEQRRAEAEVPFNTWQTVVRGSVPPLPAVSLELGGDSDMWLFSTKEKLNAFNMSVTSLLLEVWAEVDPGVSGSSAVNPEVIQTLKCIMKIVDQLWSITQICTQENPMEATWVRSGFKEKFTERLMSGFPYLMREPLKKKGRNQNKPEASQTSGDSGLVESVKHCDDLNVILTQYAMKLCPPDVQDKVVRYLTNLLQDAERDESYNMTKVIELVMELLAMLKDTKPKSRLVAASFRMYLRMHPLRKDKAALAKVLLTATHHDHKDLWSNQGTQLWSEQLVKDLVGGEVTEGLVQAATVLKLRGYGTVRDLLHQNTAAITREVKTKGVKNLSEAQLEEKLRFLFRDCGPGVKSNASDPNANETEQCK